MTTVSDMKQKSRIFTGFRGKLVMKSIFLDLAAAIFVEL
jgi:hypothetical protein